ncbi:MAG: tetratricopeptide repeat protein [Bacteroidia bacterium]
MKRSILSFFTLILFYFHTATLSAQQHKIDSLLTLLRTDKQDTNRVWHLLDLCWKYKNKGDFDKGMSCGMRALHLADSITVDNKKGWPKAVAIAYNHMGLIAQHQGDFALSIKYHEASLKIRKALGSKKGIGQSYNNLGIVYESQGDFQKSLECYLEAIKMDDAIGDKKALAGLYGNVGVVYWSLRKKTEALKNYELSLKIYQELGDKKGVANLYNNIGVLYLENNELDKALENYTLALEMNKELGDQQGIATMYMNRGVLYKDQGNLSKALDDNFAALKMVTEMGDKNSCAVAHINIGDVYVKQHKFADARTELLKGLKIAAEIGSRENISFAYERLSLCDSATGDWKAAYLYEKLFKQINDSLFNAGNAQKTAELSTRYDNDRKESQIKLMEKDKETQIALAAVENKRHNTVLISVLCGLTLMILFSLFMFNRWRITQKQKKIIELQKAEVDKQRDLADSRRIIAEEQRHVIQNQKTEVERQKTMVEEHQREIIDSITYAKRLQEAILPPDDYVRKNLPNSFILYKPKDIVAGDFYWMEIRDDIIFIAAADCTGHGVPGAMVSIVCSNALNRTIKEFGLRNTGDILDKVTELVIETFEKSDENVMDGMDISLLAINRKTNQLQWSGANNPLWYIQKGELHSITANKQPIGKHDNRKPFTAHNLEPVPGTTYYLFTDGYADQFGGSKGKKFKYKQLEETLISLQAMPLADQRDILDKTLTGWRGKLEQVDDVCILGIQLS